MTIHYRWHPWYGRTLAVKRRVSRGGRDFVHCELPDGTIGSIPSWMADAAMCAVQSAGPPLPSLAALVELRRLLDAAGPNGTARSPRGGQPPFVEAGTSPAEQNKPFLQRSRRR